MTGSGPEFPMAILDCTLPAADLEAQIDRYRRLGANATAIEHDHLRLLITFGPTLDDQLLKQTIAVERECCSFFTLDYNAAQRRLSVVVDDPGRAGALDAIRIAVTVERRSLPEL